MPYQTISKGFIGVSQVQIRPWGDPASPPISVGNASALSYKYDVDTQDRLDCQSPGGGKLDSISRIKGVSGEITLDDFSPEMMAVGQWGSVLSVAAGEVTNEPHIAWPGINNLLDFIPDHDAELSITVAVTAARAATADYVAGALIVQGGHLYSAAVAGKTGATAPTTWPTDGGTVVDGEVTWSDLGAVSLTAGTSYERTASGFRPSAGAQIWQTTGLPVKVSYTKNKGYVIHAITNSGLFYELVSDGLNEANGEAPHVTRFHKVKFSPFSEVPLIGNKFGELKLPFEVLKDTTKVGAGLSKYLHTATV